MTKGTARWICPLDCREGFILINTWTAVYAARWQPDQYPGAHRK